MTNQYKRYPVQLEVAGPMAMFARPDTGGTPTSYPIPTWSAAKGMMESIAFLANGAAWICPVRVEVCRLTNEPGGQIRFSGYTANYGGPMRKTDLFVKGSAPGGSSMQLRATVVLNACYRIHGLVVGRREPGINRRHQLQEMFNRRVKRGQCARPPRLGWSECTCSYWGEFRTGTAVDLDLNLEIPSMLLGMFDNPVRGNYAPTFSQDVRVTGGALDYPIPESWLESTSESAC